MNFYGHSNTFSGSAHLTKKSALLASCLALLVGLSGCSGDNDYMPQLADREGYLAPPPENEVAETPFSHAVNLAPVQVRLDGGQNTALSNFLASIGRDRGDHYEIRTAYTSSSPEVAGRNNHIARELRRSFISQGVYADRIQLVHVPGYDNKLELTVRRYTVISPACGVIDVNQGNSWEDEPTQTRKFGCSNAFNLGQMLADPRDLVGGRTLDPSSGEREALGVRQHGTNTVPDLKKTETSTTGK
jgi:pilus biogenesis lipoprotein CpaD